jgi:hypothetical protein
MRERRKIRRKIAGKIMQVAHSPRAAQPVIESTVTPSIEALQDASH